MGNAGTIVTRCEAADHELVASVRMGDEGAFEALYTRYRPRIASFVRGMLRDEARAEEVTQDAFLSALRHLRATDGEIAFKPWIYRIARNAAIDVHRHASRAEEISIDAGGGLRRSDHLRLVTAAGPESELIERERLDHLRGAFDELSQVHTQVLVMRELEGRSYREIGERLELTRPAVETALSGARRRLEAEYAELSEGRRCASMRGRIARIADGTGSEADARRLARHAHRCSVCRRRARELGVEPLAARGGRGRLAALLPGGLPGMGQLGGLFGERAAALVAMVAVAGAGGAAYEIQRDSGPPPRPAQEERLSVEPAPLAVPSSGLERQGPAGPASPARGFGPAASRRPGLRGLRTKDRRTAERRSPGSPPAAPNGPASNAPGPAPGPGAPSAGTAPASAPVGAPAPAGPSRPGRKPSLPAVPPVSLPRPPSAGGGPSLPAVPPVSLPRLPSPGGPGGAVLPDPVPPVVNRTVGAVEGTANSVTGQAGGVTGGLDGVTGSLPGGLP